MITSEIYIGFFLYKLTVINLVSCMPNCKVVTLQIESEKKQGIIALLELFSKCM